MTARVFLHLGMHKTGTTTLQNSFDGYDDGARRYLRLGDTPNHSIAFALLYGHLPKTDPRATAPPETLEPLRTRLRAEWAGALAEAKADGRDLIVSGEGLPTQVLGAGVGTLIGDIRAAGFTPTACAYIRDPVAFSASVMSQLLKSGTFIFDPEILWPKYRFRYETWRTELGPENLRLRPYDRAGMLADFADWAGLDRARASTKPHDRNISPSAETLAIVAMAWHHGAALHSTGLTKGAQLLRPLHGFGHGLALPDAAGLDQAAQRNAAQTAWMEEIMGAPLPRETPEGAVHHIAGLDDLAALARKSLPAAEAHIRHHLRGTSGGLGTRLRVLRTRAIALRALKTLNAVL